MEADMQASLEAVIDPNSPLASASLSPAPSLPLIQPDNNAPTSQSNATPKKPKTIVTMLKAGQKPRKTRASITPNSAADFRRREANRLAAERSRSRTSEKYTALDYASKSLSEENQRLRRQIAELENGNKNNNDNQPHSDEILVPVSQIIPDHPHADAEEIDNREQQGTNSEGEMRKEENETQMGIEDLNPSRQEQEQEQEAHSNTILAALTGITGVDFSEGNEASWMQGMESLLKDSEASGRLAELAVVATTGQNDSSGQQNQDYTHQQTSTENSSHPPLIEPDHNTHNITYHTDQDSNELTLDHNDQPHEIQRGYPTSNEMPKGLIPSPANNPIIALAAAINTEIERIIMEDLAITKAAIATVEQQIESLKENPASELQELAKEDQEDLENSLPQSLLIDDIEKLVIRSSEMVNETRVIQDGLPHLHENLIKLRDEKTEEENKIAELIKQVKSIAISDESDKKTFINNLIALGGFVESLLTESQPGDLSYAIGSYSTPAIARRRRGRPPKGDISRTFYQSFLLKYSPSTASTSNASPTKSEFKQPKIRAARKSKKSKLPLSSEKEHQDDAAEEEENQQSVQENVRQIQASAIQENEREQEQAESPIVPNSQSQPEGQPVSQVETQIQTPVNERTQSQQAVHAPDLEVENNVTNNQEEGAIELGTIDHEATVEAVNRAEAFILSQLASASQNHGNHQEDHERDNNNLTMHQSTSFADFLPAQEELERQADQQQHNNSDMNQLINPQLNQQQQQQQDISQNNGINNSNNIDNSIIGTARQAVQSALARLKKGPPGSCDICMRTETTVWRKLVLGDQILKVCNACGLYHKKFGVIRPPELWDDGNSIRRRRTGPRASTSTTKLDGEQNDDGERPSKRAKKEDESISRVDEGTEQIVHGNITENANNGTAASLNHLDIPEQIPNNSGNNGDEGDEGDEDDHRRAELNAALMEGITAISAVPPSQLEEEEILNTTDGEEEILIQDVQMDDNSNDDIQITPLENQNITSKGIEQQQQDIPLIVSEGHTNQSSSSNQGLLHEDIQTISDNQEEDHLINEHERHMKEIDSVFSI